MPGAWSTKDEHRYEKIRDAAKKRDMSTERAKELAARTVNSRRREEGRTPNRTTQGTGNPNDPYEERSKDELYNLAKERHIAGRSSMTKSDLVRALRR